MERQHHPLSMSKWPMWAQCAHFTPTEKETSATLRGTDDHLNFQEILDAYNTGIPPLRESENAKWAADFVIGIQKTEGNGADIFTEAFVQLPMNGDVITGYCDAIIDPGENDIYFFDYKSGAKSELDSLIQVAGYAAAYISRQPEGKAKHEINAHCYVLYGANHQFVQRTYSYTSLIDLSEEIINRRLNKDETIPVCCCACQYCKNKEECPTMNNALTAIKVGAISTMSSASRYALLASVKSACEKMMDDLKEEARNNGGVLEDQYIKYEIKKDKRGRLQSINIPSVYARVVERGIDITQSEMMSLCTLSKTAYKDALKDKAKACGIKVKELDELYEAYATYGEGSERLVKTEKA